MLKKSLFLFLLFNSVNLKAQDPNLLLALTIPSELRENANAVVRLNDIQIDIMSASNTGANIMHRASISNEFDLTSVEKYEAKRFCENNEYNKPATTCNYYYKNVNFEVTIPLSTFKYPQNYDFYLFVHSKNSGKTFFHVPKLCSPPLTST